MRWFKYGRRWSDKSLVLDIKIGEYLIEVLLYLTDLLLFLLVLLVQVAIVRPHLPEIAHELERRLVLSLVESVPDRH